MHYDPTDYRQIESTQQIYYNPYSMTPLPPAPPISQRKGVSVLKLLLAILLTFLLMGFSGLGGYLVHGESTALSQRSSPIAQVSLASFDATATAIAHSSDATAKAAYQSGYQAGYASGKQDGYAKGYSDGVGASQGNANNSYQQGYNDGLKAAQTQITASYNQGKQDGYNSGYSIGYAAGKQNGYNAGYADGYNKGKLDGYNSGYTNGYNKGYSDGYNAEYTNLWNWVYYHCHLDSYGYYEIRFDGNGAISCL